MDDVDDIDVVDTNDEIDVELGDRTNEVGTYRCCCCCRFRCLGEEDDDDECLLEGVDASPPSIML